jgi:hypothetical protein
MQLYDRIRTYFAGRLAPDEVEHLIRHIQLLKAQTHAKSSPDYDPSLSAASVAAHEDCSVITLDRRIRLGQFPRADFQQGPYRYWKLSTVLAARERRIAQTAETIKRRREKQAASAAAARAAHMQKRKRAADGNRTQGHPTEPATT